MDLADKNNKKGFCRKKISVIIPVYNAEKYIRETLDSIIKQSYENWEIILVENGSEDKSPDIIREYEEKEMLDLKLHRESTSCLWIPMIIFRMKMCFISISALRKV